MGKKLEKDLNEVSNLLSALMREAETHAHSGMGPLLSNYYLGKASAYMSALDLVAWACKTGEKEC